LAGDGAGTDLDGDLLDEQPGGVDRHGARARDLAVRVDRERAGGALARARVDRCQQRSRLDLVAAGLEPRLLDVQRADVPVDVDRLVAVAGVARAGEPR